MILAVQLVIREIFHPCPGQIDAWKMIHFLLGMGHLNGLSWLQREFFLPRSFEKSQANQRLVPKGRCGRSFPQQPSVYGFSAWSTWPLGAWCNFYIKRYPDSPSLRHNLQLEGLPAIKKGVSCGHNMFPRDLQKDLRSTSFQAVMGCCNFEAADLWRGKSPHHIWGELKNPFLEFQQKSLGKMNPHQQSDSYNLISIWDDQLDVWVA